MNNTHSKIHVMHYDADGKYRPRSCLPDGVSRFHNICDNYETYYPNTVALLEALSSGALSYSDILKISGEVDLELLKDYICDKAIVHHHGASEDITLFPNMDTIMVVDDGYGYNASGFELSWLCNFTGPLDIPRLFSVTDFMAVWGSEFEGCDKLDVDINYSTVEFGHVDDHGYAFMNSKINPPIDKWLVDEKAITLQGWFINSEFNQPLNNWKLTKLDAITGTFFRSKFNHPLDKWYTKPITIYAILTFAESDFHQDLSMWKINPDSICDGMFYKSKYTIEEVSKWPWVKTLNQPVEDLFKLGGEAEDFYNWFLEDIED